MIFLDTHGICVHLGIFAAKLRFCFLSVCAIIILPILLGMSEAKASDFVRSVVLTGDTAPVPNEVAVFGDFFGRETFGVPTLNASGQTSFMSELMIAEDHPLFGTRFDYVASIFRENDANELAPVAIEDGIVPGTGGTETFSSIFGPPAMNGNGQTAFLSSSGGVFLDDNGVLQPIVLNGSTTPLLPGKVLNVFSRNPTLNNFGQVAFRAGIFDPGTTSTTDSGLFLGEAGGGDLTPIARDGDAVLNAIGDVNLFSFSEPTAGNPLNSLGQVALSAFLSGNDVDGSNHTAFLRAGEDGLKLVARQGDPAPVPGTNANFANLANSGIPTLNNLGHLAFRARLSGFRIDVTNDMAIFSEGLGRGLELVAREGDTAPVQGADVKFGGSLGNPILNGQGSLVFTASLTGEDVDDTNDQAVFRQNSNGVVELIARSGGPTPLPEITFASGRGFAYSINGRGQVALISTFSDGTRGILAEDSLGQLRVIARKGDLLNVSDDPQTPDFREISTLVFYGNTGNEDGRSSSFNDLGQLAFRARFTDNTEGIFVSNLVAVPEPTTCALTLAAVCLASRRRR